LVTLAGDHPGDATSSMTRRLDGGDVDLDHRHHGLESTL
jgi:hypothetical protein